MYLVKDGKQTIYFYGVDAYFKNGKEEKMINETQYKMRKKFHRFSCKECGERVAVGYLESHLMTQHGRVAET